MAFSSSSLFASSLGFLSRQAEDATTRLALLDRQPISHESGKLARLTLRHVTLEGFRRQAEFSCKALQRSGIIGGRAAQLDHTRQRVTRQRDRKLYSKLRVI